MKPMLLFFIAFNALQTSAQTFQLDNLTYGKRDSRVVFAGENFFRVTSNRSFSGLEWDKSLADVQLRNDSLIISIIHKVKLLPEKKSNWDGKNDELQVAFLLNNGDRVYTKFFYRKLPNAFASLSAQPERAKIDKANFINLRRVEITVTSPDTEGFFSNYKVQKFKLLVNNKAFEITGDQLSEEALVAIASMQSGDKLTLQNVETFDDVAKKNLRFGPTIYYLK